MAYILKTTGETEPLTDTSLAALQKAVGGNIELLHTTDGQVMFVNEDGKKLQLQTNPMATGLWRGQSEKILGDVVIGDEAEFNDD